MTTAQSGQGKGRTGDRLRVGLRGVPKFDMIVFALALNERLGEHFKARVSLATLEIDISLTLARFGPNAE